MAIRHFCYDPTLAPEGKSVIAVMFDSNYAYWAAISGERERYEAEKNEIALQVIDRLEKRFPGISRQVESVDVATPLTYERHTGNWQGSMEGWLITREQGREKAVSGLQNWGFKP
jgi:phytoene dehydrogenase-like protein